jgi:hypothetical protein
VRASWAWEKASRVGTILGDEMYNMNFWICIALSVVGMQMGTGPAGMQFVQLRSLFLGLLFFVISS